MPTRMESRPKYKTPTHTFFEGLACEGLRPGPVPTVGDRSHTEPVQVAGGEAGDSQAKRPLVKDATAGGGHVCHLHLIPPVLPRTPPCNTRGQHMWTQSTNLDIGMCII